MPCSCDYNPRCLSSLGTASSGIWDPKSAFYCPGASPSASSYSKVVRETINVPVETIENYYSMLGLRNKNRPKIGQDLVNNASKNKKRTGQRFVSKSTTAMRVPAGIVNQGGE